MVRTRRTLGAAVAAALGAAILSACGSSSYSGPNLAKGLSAQQLQAQSQVQALKLTSFVLGLNGTIAVAAQPKALGSSALAPLFGGSPIPVAGTGPVVPPDQFSLGLSISIAGTNTPVTLIQTGGHLYAVALGRNILLPVAHATTDLQRVIVGLIHTMTAPTLGSTKTIAGVPAQEISGNLSGVAASSLVEPVLNALPVTSVTKQTRAQRLARQDAIEKALSQGTLHEWVRVSDLRPADVEVVATIANGPAISPALEHAAFEITFDLSNYNAPQTITAPANPVPMSTTQLQGLLGAG
jgi:hypothetical protein